jgi:acetyl/propionyl-CoA carboxylase alpha subunit
MLGKLIAWGNDREEAIARMRRALDEYYARGIKTNVSLFRRILATQDFQTGAIYTSWLDDFLRGERQNGCEVADSPARDDISLHAAEDAAIFAAALWHTSQDGASSKLEGYFPAALESRWKLEGRREQVDREPER